MTDNTLNSIAALIGVLPSDILNIYQYGSRVYGSHMEHSDFDYIVVGKDYLKDSEYKGDTVDITLYTQESFLNKIENHEISCLECLWLSDEFKVESVKFGFELNLSKLRESISAKASNSYVKCKKKLTVIDSLDSYVGKKSLWHTFRMVNFGTQIATHGRIIDYKAVNSMFPEIMNMPIDWEIIKAKYQPLYNAAMSKFRIVAPKG